MNMAEGEDMSPDGHQNLHDHAFHLVGDHDYFFKENSGNKVVEDDTFGAAKCPGIKAEYKEGSQSCKKEKEKDNAETLTRKAHDSDGLEKDIKNLFSLFLRLKQINQSLMSSSNPKDIVENDDSSNNGDKNDLDLPVRDWPWIDQRFCKDKLSCIPMTPYDEEQLMKELSNFINDAEKNNRIVPTHIYLMRRRLCVRKLKRERNLKVFNFDEHLAEFVSKETSNVDNCSTVLDKLHNASENPSPVEIILSSGPYPDLSSIVSLYTNRSLKPFIWCDPITKPPWLKMLNVIEKRIISKYEVNNHSAPICYTYVRPEYMAAVNSLCSIYFWPGIDLSESLQYPDFSCIALYKKLIVGFAFMVPDVTATDCYISFLLTRAGWRNCGIASFMIYHLIQSCMGKDITLHVAADNPSLFLYQKFGFKVEKFVKNYYEKYLPVSSKQCKHALFLRLSR